MHMYIMYVCMETIKALELAVGLCKSLNLFSTSTLVNMCNTGGQHHEESQYYCAKSQNTAQLTASPQNGEVLNLLI